MPGTAGRRLPAFALAAIGTLSFLAAAAAEAQPRMAYARTVQFQIRHVIPGRGCTPGFGFRTFNYAGWGVRNWCIRCPSGYVFAQTANYYACVTCPPGTYHSYYRGYRVCIRR